jgi:hypothetical protein
LLERERLRLVRDLDRLRERDENEVDARDSDERVLDRECLLRCLCESAGERPRLGDMERFFTRFSLILF